MESKINFTPLLDTLRLEKIDDATYFSEQYSNYISNSRLSLINPSQGGSPEQFFRGFKTTYSPAFQLGSAVHQKVLQDDLFEICQSIDKPTAKVGALADLLYNICKGEIPTSGQIKEQAKVIDYYGGNLSENQINTVIAKSKVYWTSRREFESTYTGSRELIYLDPRSRETVSNCVEAINSNKKIQSLLHPSDSVSDVISENEQAILLDIRVDIENTQPFILKLKAKLDNYTIDPLTEVITVNDVKTIGKFVSEMEGNIEKFHYNREFAVYSYLLSKCAEKYYNIVNPTIKGNYLCVSTIPKYYTKVIPLTKTMFRQGMKEFQYCMNLIAYNVATKYKDFGIWI